MVYVNNQTRTFKMDEHPEYDNYLVPTDIPLPQWVEMLSRGILVSDQAKNGSV